MFKLSTFLSHVDLLLFIWPVTSVKKNFQDMGSRPMDLNTVMLSSLLTFLMFLLMCVITAYFATKALHCLLCELKRIKKEWKKKKKNILRTEYKQEAENILKLEGENVLFMFGSQQLSADRWRRPTAHVFPQSSLFFIMIYTHIRTRTKARAITTAIDTWSNLVFIRLLLSTQPGK